MERKDIKIAYDQFFNKTDAGKYFIEYVNSYIAGQHDKAEDTPELARDFVQSAKGAREIVKHIRSFEVDLIKGKYSK
jgi:hypothetical protein